MVIRNNIIPFKGYKLINLFGIIFARKKAVITNIDLNHEMIHTALMKELLYIFFYLWYVIEFIIRFIGNGFLWKRAYKNIWFEQEAFDYLNCRCYLKHRLHYKWFNYKTMNNGTLNYNYYNNPSCCTRLNYKEDRNKFDPTYPKENDNHAYVDLGLPSGTLWATMNVGATKPEEYGLYFQWGDTKGYTADQIGNGEGLKAFTWNDYKWTKDGGSTMSKYNATDGKTILDLEDDAVAANWGGEWHMPTEAQCRELLFSIEYVSNTWTTINGVNGCLFTSRTNGNTLFVPAAGVCDGGSVSKVGSFGYVWTSSLDSSNDSYALRSQFSSGGVGINNYHRYFGLSVRGVK